MSALKPCPVAPPPHPSEFIRDEMDSRNWSLSDLAKAMGDDYGVNRVSLVMYFTIGPDNRSLRIGKETASQLSQAFGISAEYFLNLEIAWLADGITSTEAKHIRTAADALAAAAAAYRATPGTIPAGARLDAALAAYKQAVEGGE